MIGDAPCHGKKYTGALDDHYPDGSPEGLTVEALMKEYCKLDIEFSMIKLNNSVDTMIEAMRQHHQELDIKDMSSQTVEKAIADHVINMPASSAYAKSYDVFGGDAGTTAESRAKYLASMPEDEEEADDGYSGAPMKKGGKKAIMKMAMDREFASYAIKNTKMAVSKHRAKKKMYAACEEE